MIIQAPRSRIVAATLVLGVALAGCSSPDPSPGQARRPGASSPPPASALTAGLAASLARSREGGASRPVAPVAAGGTNAPSPSSVASLPDRGELLAADPAIAPRREGAFLWHSVRLSEAHALASIAKGWMRLRTPRGELVNLRYERHQEHPSGDWSWIGRVEGVEDGVASTVITFGREAAYGDIPQPSGAPPLRIMTRFGKTWLGEATRAALDAEARRQPMPDYLVPERKPAATTRRFGPEPAMPAAADATTLAMQPQPIVDLLIGYTPGVVRYLGSTSAAVTRMNYYVDFTNNILFNSKVHGRLRLVHTAQANYPDHTSMYDALNDLAGTDGHAVPASLQPLHGTLRDRYGADLVMLVRQGGCGGLAFLVGGGQTPIDASDAGAGFSTVHEPGCADGLVIPHELGHNLGVDHDLETTQGNRGGAYPYAHGYRTLAPDGSGIADIMAYTAGHTKYHYYSNPDIVVRGAALGSATDGDASRTINSAFPLVATFRSTKVFSGYRPRNDVNGDGRSDLVFHDPTRYIASHWQMRAHAVFAAHPGQGFSPGSRLVASGDFNGDGRTDLIWLTVARELYLWRSTGSRWTPLKLQAPALAAAWNVVGAADITGDGRPELLLVNQATRRFTYWIINGTTPAYQSHFAIGAGDRLVATGDFNRDGQQDLVWQGESRQLRLWWSNGSTLDVAPAPISNPLNAGWRVLGAGDVNGDGRSDLLFFNADTKLFTYWLMWGTQRVGGGTGVQVPNAAFSTFGDFNGDGKVDLVWRNSTQLTMWFSAGGRLPGSYAHVARPVPAGWWLATGGVGGG